MTNSGPIEETDAPNGSPPPVQEDAEISTSESGRAKPGPKTFGAAVTGLLPVVGAITALTEPERPQGWTIAGLVLSVLVGAGCVTVLATRNDKSKPETVGLLAVLALVTISAIVLLMIMLGWLGADARVSDHPDGPTTTAPSTPTPGNPAELSIELDKQDRASVPRPFDLYGTLSGSLPDGYSIWVINRASGTAKTTWHDSPCLVDGLDMMCSQIAIGHDKKDAHTYVIEVLLASPEVASELQKSGKQQKDDPDTPVFHEGRPDGAKLLKRMVDVRLNGS